MELVNTDIAYKFIRERILNGVFAAGAPLASKNLSVDIGVSRTPFATPCVSLRLTVW